MQTSLREWTLFLLQVLQLLRFDQTMLLEQTESIWQQAYCECRLRLPRAQLPKWEIANFYIHQFTFDDSLDNYKKCNDQALARWKEGVPGRNLKSGSGSNNIKTLTHMSVETCKIACLQQGTAFHCRSIEFNRGANTCYLQAAIVYGYNRVMFRHLIHWTPLSGTISIGWLTPRPIPTMSWKSASTPTNAVSGSTL